jgi:hypothetical protein
MEKEKNIMMEKYNIQVIGISIEKKEMELTNIHF